MNIKKTPSPSSIEQLHEEHHGIRQQMKIIETLVNNRSNSAFQEWIDELKLLTEELQSTLERHFEFEEKGGFMQPVLEVRPTKSEAVQELLDEHENMHERLEALRRSLTDAGQTDWETFSNDYLELISLIRHHERAENELLQEVFTQDLGTGD